MAHDIYFDLYINASKQEVFDAFCLPEHLEHWWTFKSSGEPELDATYNLNFTDRYNWFAKVSSIKPNEYFYLEMIDSDKDWLGTTFGITLEEDNTRTLVKFSHTNWLENNHHYRFSAFCWSQLLQALKNYIEKGIMIPFEQRN